MASLTPGQSLDQRFTLLHHLAVGGMAEVWLVRDEELGEEIVAKVLPPGASDELVSLLRRECLHARRLKHPHIVPVFDFRRGADFTYITMAHVDGGDIGSFRGHAPAEILQVIAPVVDALHHAHESGVVHRDVKVSNVLLDRNGRPMLADFGIAGLLETEDPVRAGGSRYGASPQQLAGEEPRPADDVYAVGVLLYELITGRPPLWPDATEERIRSEGPEPMRASHPIPAGLQKLVADMLAKSPAERPPTMAAVRREIDAIRSAPPAEAPAGQTAESSAPSVIPPPRIRPIQPPERRPPAVAKTRRGPSWLTIAIIVFLAVDAFVLFRWMSSGDKDGSAREETSIPSEAPREEVAESPSMTETPSPGELLVTLQEEAQLQRRARAAAGRAEGLQTGLEEHGVSIWGADDYRSASDLLASGREHLEAKRYAEAERAFLEATRRLDFLEASSLEILGRTLAEGNQSLTDGDAAAAAAAFELAAIIAPGNATAATGLRRAGTLDQVMALLDAGAADENDGNLAGARKSYRQAASLDPLSQGAQESLGRVEARISHNTFAATMSEALGALGRRDYQAALTSLDKADAMKPRSDQVAEVRRQVEDAQKLDAINHHRARAVEHEEAERWHDALKAYEAVLQVDGAVRFAQDGAARCRERADLTDRIEFQVTHPERLTSETVYQEAKDLLLEASQLIPAGPRHEAQVAQLRELLSTAGTRVRVRLESDDRTEVTVYQVGRMGTFFTLQLELRPGTYTVVGSRSGYRDVRRKLVVAAGEQPEPLVILCEEKI